MIPEPVWQSMYFFPVMSQTQAPSRLSSMMSRPAAFMVRTFIGLMYLEKSDRACLLDFLRILFHVTPPADYDENNNPADYFHYTPDRP